MVQTIPAKAAAAEIISRDPTTGEEIGRAPLTMPEEVARAVDRARQALNSSSGCARPFPSFRG